MEKKEKEEKEAVEMAVEMDDEEEPPKDSETVKEKGEEEL